MIQSIINNLSDYLIKDIFKILPGNFLIGKGVLNSDIIEIRYAFTENIFYQHLIDDVWSEEDIWQDSQITNKKKIVLYLCHNDIRLEKTTIEIDSNLIISKYFSSISKYYISITEEIKDLLINATEITSNNTINTLHKQSPNNSIKISIITTVYNNAVLLEQSIQSVINQSNKNFEYIIKDAGSKDNFLSIIEKYRPYISKVIVKPDKGIYYGMHEGIESCLGQYISCLNSDDLFADQYTINYINNSIDVNQTPLLYGNIVMYKDSSFLFRKGNIKRIYTETSLYHPSIVIQKEKYFEIGGFNYQYKIAADLDVILKLLKHKNEFVYLNKTITIFRFGGASSSSFQMLREELLVRKRNNALKIKGFIYLVLRFIKHKLIKH